MNILLTKPEELAPDGLVHVTGNRALHIKNVLHCTPGATLRCGMLNSYRFTGILRKISQSDATIEIHERLDTPERTGINLLLAMPRPKVMKRLWAQLAALGVDRIMITNADKVEKYYFDSHALDPSVREQSLMEGLQQAGDTQMPEASIHRDFPTLIKQNVNMFDVRLTGHPSANSGLAPCIDRNIAMSKTLVAIGPEGGWSKRELDLLLEYDFHLFAISKRILRTDTACIAILSILHHLADNKLTVF